MNRNQRLVMRERKIYFHHAKKILPFTYKICVRLSKRPNFKGKDHKGGYRIVVNKLLLTLSNLLKIHIQPIVGIATQEVWRRPHFHAIVLTDKPINIGLVNDCWWEYRYGKEKIIPEDTKENLGVHMTPYYSHDSGNMYVNAKHIPLDFRVYCPAKRNKTVLCGGNHNFEQCKIHKYLRKRPF